MNLDKDKLVIEELSRMKSLFRYERGKVISEQEFNEDVIGAPERAELNKIDPGTEHRSAGDIAAADATAKAGAAKAAAAKAAADKAVADKAKDAEWDAKPDQERINGVFCSVNSDEIIKVDRPSWNGIEWAKYLETAKPRPTTQEIAAAKASCPTAWLSTQDIYKQTKTHQERINGVYCSVRNGIITIERPEWKGKTWEQYVTDTKTTEDEIATAKKSCKKAYSLFPAPQELKSKQGGVKAFQDWAVSNGFGSELGPTGADSKFGKFTKAAWEKHKDEYLNKSSTVSTGYEDYGGVSGDNKPAGNVQTPAGNVNQTPAGNVQTPTGNVQTPTGSQSSLEQMPKRDTDYFSDYQ
jgi:hypothetical protein